MADEQIYYSKIPNFLFNTFMDKDNNKEIKCIYPLIKDEKALLVFDYLYINTNRRNITKFSVEDIIIDNGLTPNPRKNRINDQILMILIILQNLKLINTKDTLGTIELEEDKSKKIVTTINSKKIINCTLNINYNKWFVVLTDVEKKLILEQQLIKIDNVKLLYYYCYIKSKVYKRKPDDTIDKNGGRAEVCWLTYESINEDIGLSDETIYKYNDILVKLNLVRIGNAGRWYYSTDKDKFKRESPNFFSLFDGIEEHSQTHIEEGIKYYKSLEINANKVFTDSREYKNNNRVLNGEYGYLVKKEKNNKATPEDIKRKNEILESKYADTGVFKIMSLLEANPDMALHEVYENLRKDDLSDKYYDIELSLGLINKNGKILVDRDYYIHAIANYKESDKEYLCNCIAKHKRENGLIDEDDLKNIVEHVPRSEQSNIIEDEVDFTEFMDKDDLDHEDDELPF